MTKNRTRRQGVFHRGNVCSCGYFWYNKGMAIAKNGEPKQINSAEGQSFDIYNGDWEALKEVTEKWGFRDEESALRYALAVLTLANPGTISVGGKILDPADSLIKDKNGGKNQ